MPLEEITGLRDLTFSRWHRGLPPDCTWIDIDCCHYCRYCGSLLALFELVRSADESSLEEACRHKVAAVAERVGLRAGIPTFKIAYCGEPLQAAAVMRAGEPAVTMMPAEQLARWIDRLHDCAFCRRHASGRFKHPCL